MTYTPGKAQIRFQELTGSRAFYHGWSRAQIANQPHVPKVLMEARLRGYDKAAEPRKEAKEQGK